MSTTRWVVGGAIVGTYLWWSYRRTLADIDEVIVKAFGAVVPAGWRRITNAEVTLEMRDRAVEILHSSAPRGSLTEFFSGGKLWGGLVEEHFDQRRGSHRGVTLLAKKEA